MRTPLPSDWDGLIRCQLEHREANFLETVRRAIFARADHPYHQMFQLAGRSYQDLAGAVNRNGLEPTLAARCESRAPIGYNIGEAANGAIV